MMDFINNHLTYILIALFVLFIIAKINSIHNFIMLGAESPNPGPRTQHLRGFFGSEIISAILSVFFFLLYFDWFWIWEILAGIFGVWVAEAVLLFIWFGIIENFFIWFYDKTKVGQTIRRRHQKIEEAYREYEQANKEALERDKKRLEEWFQVENDRR